VSEAHGLLMVLGVVGTLAPRAVVAADREPEVAR
jgi:hypothetical protein